MEQKIKQRLVGALVLVALAVIFVPVILEGPSDEWTPRSHDIPVPPAIEYRSGMELPLPSPVDEPVPAPIPSVKEETVVKDKTDAPGSAESKPAGQALVEEKPASVNKPAKKVQQPVAATADVETATPAKGWYVQVGSFSQDQNASGLSTRIEKAGFNSQVEDITGSKGHIYRVLVGPVSSKAAAEKLARQLSNEMQLKGLVVDRNG